jgi:hypothetical protein
MPDAMLVVMLDFMSDDVSDINLDVMYEDKFIAQPTVLFGFSFSSSLFLSLLLFSKMGLS